MPTTPYRCAVEKSTKGYGIGRAKAPGSSNPDADEQSMIQEANCADDDRQVVTQLQEEEAGRST
jgi:hypothetical protein